MPRLTPSSTNTQGNQGERKGEGKPPYAFVLLCFAATQLALQVQQERTQVV